MSSRHNKFKDYWKEIGSPRLEVVEVGHNNWCKCTDDPMFYDDCDYRIADDRHFELRRKWIDSDRKLPIEFDANVGDGFELMLDSPSWLQCNEYREAQVAEEINHNNQDSKIIAGIDATLAERGIRYGSFSEHARITQNIKRAMVDSKNWQSLSDDKREALEMVAHKIGRILNGDPDHADSWHDIIGYSKLVEDTLPINS